VAGEETTWLLESILNVLFDTGGIGGGPRDINNPSYLGQLSANNLHSQGLNTATAISQSGPPPMPPVSNNTFKIDSNNQVVSSPATYPTSTQVQVTGSKSLVGSSTSSSQPFQSSTL
jgi:hypothetical protein